MIDGRQCLLEDYDCSLEDAERFVSAFQTAFARIPPNAAEIISRHWAQFHDAPHVWLLRSSREWGGSGWAATTDQGRSLAFVAFIAGHLPDEHLELFVAHEFGHALCLALGEPTHIEGRDRIRAEWMNWLLMEAWGFDQPAAELWMKRHVIEGGDELRLRDAPLDEREGRDWISAKRQRMQEQVADKRIPEELTPWLA